MPRRSVNAHGRVVPAMFQDALVISCRLVVWSVCCIHGGWQARLRLGCVCLSDLLPWLETKELGHILEDGFVGDFFCYPSCNDEFGLQLHKCRSIQWRFEF